MLCVPPQQSAGQSFVSKWKDNQRFPVSSYRSKNSTIVANENVEQETNESNSIESETARDAEDETTVTENYAVQEEEEQEQQTERDTTDDNNSYNSESITTEGFSYTTEPATEYDNLTE